MKRRFALVFRFTGDQQTEGAPQHRPTNYVAARHKTAAPSANDWTGYSFFIDYLFGKGKKIVDEFIELFIAGCRL